MKNKIMKLLIMQFSAVSCHFLLLRSNRSTRWTAR